MPAAPRPSGRPKTANDRTVLSALRAAGRPQSAYDLIDRLKDQGIVSPPTVYRALNRLMEEGIVHRLESLNAFVACACDHAHDGAAIFAICTDCGVASEITADDAVTGLSRCAEDRGFTIDRMTVELRGRCAACGR